jgi:hypothetical protein
LLINDAFVRKPCSIFGDTVPLIARRSWLLQKEPNKGIGKSGTKAP